MVDARVTVRLDEIVGRIDPNLHGHFAEHLGGCIYGGIWVGPDSPIPNNKGIRCDVVEALARLHPPVIRWPGGCFADDYHWADGIGPRDERPTRVNLWWGEDLETNAFGTHEFLRFCDLVGAAPYMCGNVGSGTPRELKEWVEYCNYPSGSTLAEARRANGASEPFGVTYWGVGNENWGCGGNMCPEEYASCYKRYATYLRDLGSHPLYLIACGPSGNNPAWTRRFFDKLGGFRRLHGFAAHYYCGTAGTATTYSTDEWYALIHRARGVEDLVVQQRAILDSYDPQREIGLILDEWGTWHPPSEGHHPRHLWQQNTMRDALVAASTLDILHRHADKVVMSNIAQTVNVLQALVLTEGDRMLTTPTYHVYDLYQAHKGGLALRSVFDTPEISFAAQTGSEHISGEVQQVTGSASLNGDDLTLSLVNTSATEAVDVIVELQTGRGLADVRDGTARTLAADDIHAHNTFDTPRRVRPMPRALTASSGEFVISLPPASVTVASVGLGS